MPVAGQRRRCWPHRDRPPSSARRPPQREAGLRPNRDRGPALDKAGQSDRAASPIALQRRRPAARDPRGRDQIMKRLLRQLPRAAGYRGRGACCCWSSSPCPIGLVLVQELRHLRPDAAGALAGGDDEAIAQLPPDRAARHDRAMGRRPRPRPNASRRRPLHSISPRSRSPWDRTPPIRAAGPRRCEAALAALPADRAPGHRGQLSRSPM